MYRDWRIPKSKTLCLVKQEYYMWTIVQATNKKGGKANDDYDKRKNDPLGKMPLETTYINVSAKKYRDKKKWVEEKKGDNSFYFRFYRQISYSCLIFPFYHLFCIADL